MDIDLTFLPVAEELIDEVFPTPIIYRRLIDSSYDPATGEVTRNIEELSINAGVVSRSRVEEGGAAETWQLTLWVHHGAVGLPSQPATGDEVLYDGVAWKVTTIDPSYSSAKPIASKIICRAPG